jgi:carbamoyltransferase
MTITADVKKEMVEKIPAVVHVDNTARPQIINKDNNPIVYNILTEYNKITGIPLFVNTSFNIHEEPIVSSYEDAIKSLLNSCVDVLCFDDVFVKVK